MKWNQVKDGKEVSNYEGKVLTGIVTEFEGDSLKSMVLDFGGSQIRIGVAWETLRLFTPAVQYKVTGKIKVGNLKAEIDPILFNDKEEAQEKLKELAEEFESFEGQIIETLE